MTTALYLILSGILIGAGISIIWRDVRNKSRDSFILERDARGFADPEAEVTIARSADPKLARRAPAPLAPPYAAAPGSGVRARATPPDGSAQSKQSGVGPSRQSARLALEQQWSALQPAIATAVARTNTLIA